jgi:ABC-2 type transport system permease protein
MTQLFEAGDALWLSARHQMAVVRAHPLFLAGGVLQPAVLMLVMFYARGRPTGEQVVAVATAVLLMAYWGSTVWQGAAILRRERNIGTLAAFMRGVRDPLLVLTGKALGASLAPGLLAAATVIAMLAVLGEPVTVAAPGWFAIGLLAALVSGTALGTLLCSLFLLTRYGPQLSSALLYPVFLLAGLLIPPSFFPPAIRWVGWFVNLRWAQEFLVSSARGDPDFGALGLVGLLTVGYAVVGVLAFRRIDALARSRGTLELG